VDTANGIEIGAAMPPVSLRGLDGRTYDLAAYRGRPLLVFMWASW
jgi:peroxiredoxin